MKQFTLDTKNNKVAGVCSGLANYFDIDVTLIRVAVVLLTFFSGFTLLAYFILSLVAPHDFEVT